MLFYTKFFSKMKISTKLIISSAVFLIPVGVMLSFILATATAIIQKGVDEQDGINALKPAVTVMQRLPEYLNVYLGVENGDLRRIEDEITTAVRSLDRSALRYRMEGRELPNMLEEWERIRRLERGYNELFENYLTFAHSVKDLMDLIGERSGLMLVSDMNTYYFIAPALLSIPEASLRLMTTGNVMRSNLYDAQTVVAAWNAALAEAQAQGRRMNTNPFTADPRTMTMTMINDSQTVFNARPLFESDRDRISMNITAAMEGTSGADDVFETLNDKLQRYIDSMNAMTEQYGRMRGFNIQNPVNASEFSETISRVNTDLSLLWAETLTQLEIRVERNTRAAWISIIGYLIIVVVSLGLAIAFVALITLDINRSVKHLKTLFKGLNENDLTISLKVNSKDEFGELMTAFNGFLHVLRSTFGSFKQSAQLVSNSVFDISSSSKEITTTANEQSASVSEIVSTMESSKNLSEQIAFKTTEVAQLAKETQELSSKGATLREANQVMMEDIRKQNQKIISEIRNLSDMIIRISEAIRIIDGIADQTKLIAFNASLEASSSGEAGARFSVVASEIRRFADNVVESTREIKQKIEEVQGASQTLIAEANSGSKQIEIGYEGMSEQKVVFEHIVENSQNVATRSQQISNLSKQQESASSQIFTALKEISSGVKQFVIATSSTSKIADSLNGMSEDLKEKVEKYRTEISGS